MVRFSCVKPMTDVDTSSTWRRVATLLRVSAAVFAILAAHGARAELADPESFVALVGSDFALVGPGIYTKPFGSTANTASVSYSPALISAFGGYTAGARLAYQFSIIGPADVPVPISIDFSLTTSGTYDPANSGSYYYSLSLFNLSRNPDLEGPGAVIACSDSRPADNNQCESFKSAPDPLNVVGPSFSGTEGFVVGSNTDQWLSLYTYFQSGDGTGFASADPRIAIDPSFLADNPGFSLVLSPGIGNTVGTTPVPEPTGWITLAIGVAGLSLVRRRRSFIQMIATGGRNHGRGIVRRIKVRRSCLATVAAGVAICASVGGRANAGITVTPGTLTPAIYMGGDDINGYNLTSPGNYSYSIRGADDVNIVMSGLHNFVSDSQVSSAGLYPQSIAQITYAFIVSGPPAPSVPVLITYTLDASGSGDYLAQAEIIYPFGATLICTGPLNGCGQNGMQVSSYSATDQFSIAPNVANEVDIAGVTEASVAVEGTTSTALASVDPFIRVDPSFPNANQYTIQFSDGVTNGATPVDEPGALTLLAIGLPVLVTLRRRQRDRRTD